ncbi:MAG TPA: hypothetical protein VK543_11670 [Puia sp.]|nr:hypothetical protein [Puia sp.]
MLKSISWSQLIYSMTTILVIYYATILAIYYRRQVFSYARSILTKTNRKEIGIRQEPDPNNLFDLASHLASTLRLKIEEAANRNLVREELILSVQIVLKQYQKLKGTAFQLAITNLVETNTENQCFITLSDDELNMLWNG